MSKNKKKVDEPYVVQYETKQAEYQYAKFWDTRSYEDRAERMLLKGLIKSYPIKARWLVDIGGSFGRLIEVYARRFKSIVIADYATNEFYIAKEPAKKHDVKVSFLAANAYHLPFADNSQQALISVRVIHHLEDPTKFFSEIERVLAPGGVAIIESANKNHLKRWLKSLITFNFSVWKADYLDIGKSGLQADGSFHLIRNYKPSYLQDIIETSGLKVIKRRSISWLRRSGLDNLPKFITDPIEWLLQQFSGLTMMGPSNWFVVSKHGGVKVPKTNYLSTLVDPQNGKQLSKTELRKRVKVTKGAKHLDLRWPRPRR